MIQPDEDFQGYMESVEEAKRQGERLTDMYAAHEEWRQTTWGGWAVRMVQGVGNHFRPFFEALSDLLSDRKANNPLGILLFLLIRAAMVAGCITAVYLVAALFSALLHKELIIEEVIEVYESEEEDEDDEKEQSQQPRRSARLKKQQ
jgi:hypothetical protein